MSEDRSNRRARMFREGVALFNEGQWFDAHEAWEDLWNDLEGSDKRFVQGLIQCAVSLEHMRRGNPRGAVRVYESAAGKFVGLRSPYRGVDHAALLIELGAMVSAIRGMPGEVFEPGRGRGLTLPVDLRSAPRIERAGRGSPSDANDQEW